MLRLLPGLIAGIILQYHLPHPVFIETSIILILLIGSTALRFFSVQQKYRFAVWIGAGIYIIMLSLGSVMTRLHTITRHKSWIGHDVQDHSTLLVQLRETPIERKKSFKTTATIEGKWEHGKWRPVKGRLLIHFSKEEKNRALQQGDRLLIQQVLQAIDTNTNPGAFDYAAYLARNNIYHRVFLRANQYRQTDTGQSTWAFHTTQTVLSVLRQYIPGKQEQAIAEALLIGYTFDLEDELLEAYSRTGVIHVIAISGMHLGLIYGLLLVFTSPLKKIRFIKWIRPIILLVSLWTFSLLVGAGASVLRAAVIFSFMILGESLQRSNNAFNSLAASMFCLLFYNPFYLWDAGFQLSYAAVTGIMAFTRPVYRYWYVSNKAIRYVWQLLVVTCSAQIFTLPIVLYHFHQFPNLFMLTNLVIVPLSGLVLYVCIILLTVSPLAFIAQYPGKLLQFVLQWMNRFISYAEQLPFAVTDHIQINMAQIVSYLLLILFLCRWITTKQSRFLFYALFCIVTVLTAYVFRQVGIRQKNRLVIYQLPGGPVTEIFGAGKYISIGRQEQLDATLKMRKTTHTLFGGFTPQAVYTPGKYRIVSVNDITIAWLSSIPLRKKDTTHTAVDILVLQDNPPVTVAQLQRSFRAKRYVWDTNNPLWKIRKWKKEADSLHLRHHSVPEQGAFVMDF